MPPRHLVVVPHSHWDREWYATHEEFRLRLVRLVDRLLEILEGDPSFRHFTLDGQAIVLDDYLEVRPGQRERAEKLVHDGRLLVGPWYVLPDEWLVSGEALIRNLRLGLARAEAYGRSMRIGYAPDLFGHVGQLPQLFAGFGFDAAVVWRGVGANVDETLFDWEAPDGTRLLTIYLRHGYGNGVHLPLAPDALRKRLERDVAFLACSRIPTYLLMNGSDHVEPQPGLPAALEAAVRELPETTVEIGSLETFLARARAEAPADRALHRGELRSALRAPLLPGCASARMAQKRADFANDVLLTAYLEPLAAWLGLRGGVGPLAGRVDDASRLLAGRVGHASGCDVLAHAWRIALQNHPHDSICGCSIDAVHDEIDGRLARVAQIARGHLDAVGAALAEQVPGPAGGPGVLVWNPHGPGRGAVDAELELDLPLARGRVAAFHLRDAAGRRVPAAADVVDPGVTLAEFDLPAAGAAHMIEGIPDDFVGARLRELRWRRTGEGRLEVDLRLAAAPGDVDPAVAKGELLALLAAGGFERVRVRAARVPRVRLRFADELPGHGLRAYRVASGRAGGARAGRAKGAPVVRAERRADGGALLENESLRVEVAADGRVAIEHAPSGLRSEDALRVVSEGDRGDEYNFDPVPGERAVDRPERVRVSLASGEAEASVRIAARYRVPLELAPGRLARSRRSVALPVALTLRLAPGLDRLEIEVALENTARDHRLRLELATPIAPRRFRVESAFELAERPVAPARDAFGSARPSEFPIGAVPQRRFASVDDGRFALTVANRGGGEVEALPGEGGGARLALTLLRAIGWLSRGDLVLRPGDAGPPLPTPGAQVPGLHRLVFFARFHAADAPGFAAEALRDAVPALALPGRAAGAALAGRTAEAALAGREGAAPAADARSVRGALLQDGVRLIELDDPDVQVTAIEPWEDGSLRLRLLNAVPRARTVRLRLPAGLACAGLVDLADRPDGATALRREGAALALELRPWQLATLRLHAAGA